VVEPFGQEDHTAAEAEPGRFQAMLGTTSGAAVAQALYADPLGAAVPSPWAAPAVRQRVAAAWTVLQATARELAGTTAAATDEDVRQLWDAAALIQVRGALGTTGRRRRAAVA